jgi:rare lipoprotein A
VIRSPVHAGSSDWTHAIVITLLAASLALAGCARKTSAHVPAPVKPARIGATETGIASWYGVPYNGRRSANGEIYDMEKLTAAHRTLPFDTWIEVTNLVNKKRVDVRVTDRGPFVNGRIIDLSLAAAREIDMVGAGIVKVRIKVIRKN